MFEVLTVYVPIHSMNHKLHMKKREIYNLLDILLTIQNKIHKKLDNEVLCSCKKE